MSIRSQSLALALAATFLALPAHAQERPREPVLNITAEGIVHAAPDMAVVTLGVVSEKPLAADALAENNTAMSALVTAVKEAGVAERDVQTSNFTIEPVYVYPRPKDDGTQDPPRVSGYRVANTIQVRIRDLAGAGPLLDKVVKLGANQIQGIAFAVDDDAALLDEARRKAMAEARRRAQLYADAGGFKIGGIFEVSENIGSAPQPMFMRMAASPKAEMDTVPVAAGESAIRVDLSVTFRITDEGAN
ncbi:SIMPL domain-containing protein [Methylobrevis pamukkalensis]|uniref:26 kDa periplasmic immunogenic protein n=1 Tax=Methylobrevis pamukkalensis TaxID=1439726 RepID=A0A1E3H068_9HYPH|nr:SIMPL domain-containing protein [Methylobrevis pamukkalensis]ODN68971.1 26 kDa periplasmic immunogenic protein precursor [Methylobrevis pamukkalensis]